MYSALIPELTRDNLIKIAKASEVSDSTEVLAFIASLENKGKYTEATEDEIEEYDSIYDSLVYE